MTLKGTKKKRTRKPRKLAKLFGSKFDNQEYHAPLKESEIPRPIIGRLKCPGLGEPLEGYEGKYFKVLPDDETEAGYWLSGTGVKILCTIHIPTGATCSYKKVHLTLQSGEKIEVWEKHEDL